MEKPSDQGQETSMRNGRRRKSDECKKQHYELEGMTTQKKRKRRPGFGEHNKRNINYD